jgi:hypothetical protein
MRKRGGVRRDNPAVQEYRARVTRLTGWVLAGYSQRGLGRFDRRH